MSTADFVIALCNNVMQQEVENRKNKRSYVHVQPTGPATKVAKIEELDFESVELATTGTILVSSVCENGQYQASMSVPEDKQEEPQLIEAEIQQEVIRVKRKRGRPHGTTNRPKGERKEKIKKRINPNMSAFTYTNITTMALLNAPQEMATAKMVYAFARHHFPGLSTIGTWKNSLRHILSATDGFVKQKHPTLRDSFWTIIADRRKDLIRAINAKIEDNKDQMEMLMMRNVDDLPAILKGECPIPDEAEIDAQLSQYFLEERQASSSEYVEIANKRIKQEHAQEEDAPQGYWIPYGMPAGVGPYYAHPNAHAYHPAPYFGYPVSQHGYVMPMVQQPYFFTNDVQPQVQNLFNGSVATQQQLKIINQSSTSPKRQRKPKIEEPSDYL